MNWNCACGVENKENKLTCAGCGWTREQSDNYKLNLGAGIRTETNAHNLTPAIERPLTVTIISWLIIGGSILSFILYLTTIKEFQNLEIMTIYIQMINSIISIIIGYSMLGGAAWARTLFLWMCILSVIMGAANKIPGELLIIQIICLVVICGSLYRQDKKYFFKHSYDNSEKTS